MSPAPLTTALLDPTRLVVAGSLLGTVRTAAEVADRTGVEPEVVVTAISELEALGLVDPSGDGFTVDDAGMQRLTHELTQPQR